MNSNFPLFFSLNRIDRSLLPQNSIQIYPTGNNWNDFGYRTRFFVLLPNANYARELHLSFLDIDIQPGIYLKNILSEKNQTHISAAMLNDYFTMNHEINDYRYIISTFGVEIGNQVLLSLHDMVAGRKHAPHESWYQKAFKTYAFNLSFLRNSASLYAFYNGGSILDGLQFEDLRSAPEKLHLRHRVLPFSNDHIFSFNFDFESVVPKRICILIGKNGVGKSQSLRKIATSCISGDLSFTGNDGDAPKISKMIAVCTPGETYSTFPPTVDDSRIQYIRLTAVPDEIPDSGGQTLPEIILQLARIWDRKIGNNSRWEIFERAIQKILPISEISIWGVGSDFNEDLEETLTPVISLMMGG